MRFLLFVVLLPFLALPQDGDSGPGKNSSFKKRVQALHQDFERAFHEGNVETLTDLVEKHRDLTVVIIEGYVADHLDACLAMGKVPEKGSRPSLEKGLRLASIFAEKFEKPVLEEAARDVVDWSMEYIRLKSDWMDRRSEIKLRKESLEEIDPLIEELEKWYEIFRKKGDYFGRFEALQSLTHLQVENSREGAFPFLKERLSLAEDLGFSRRWANSLADMGAFYFMHNQSDIALSNMNQALEKLRELNAYQDEIRTREMRAHIYMGRGGYKKASEELEQVIAYYMEIGDISQATFQRVNLAAYMHEEGRSMREALKICDEGLKLARNEELPKVMVHATRIRGHILAELGYHDEALSCLREALKHLDDNLNLRYRIRSNIVQSLIESGRLAEAKETAEKELDALKPGTNTLFRLQMKSFLSTIAFMCMDRERSNDLMREVLQLSKFVDIPTVKCRVFSQCSINLLNEGRYDEALQFAEDAYFAVNLPDLNQSKVWALKHLARVYKKLNRRDKEREYLLKCLDLLDEVDGSIQYFLLEMDLADILVESGDYDRAERILRENLERAEERSLKHLQANVRFRLGFLLYRKGSLDAAISHLRKALEIYQEISHFHNVWATKIRLAMVLSKHRSLGEAFEIMYIKESERSVLASSYPNLYANYLSRLGSLHYLNGEMEKAYEYFVDSLRIHDTVYRRSRSLSELSLSSFAELHQWIYYYALLCLRALHAETKDPKYIEMAFEMEEKRKGRLFREYLAQAGIQSGPLIPPEMRMNFECCHARITYLQGQIDRALFDENGPGDGSIKAWREELLREQENQDEIMQRIRRLKPQYDQYQSPQILSLAEFQRLLDPSTVYLSFCLQGNQGTVLSVEKERCLLTTIDYSQELSIRESIHTLLELMGNHSKDIDRFSKISRSLYQTLLAPVEKAISGKERLIVSPDGMLNFLPMEVLLFDDLSEGSTPSFADLPYLIKKLSVVYVPSGSSFKSLLDRSIQKRKDEEYESMMEFLAFAGVPYEERDEKSLPLIAALDGSRGMLKNLPHSIEEVEAIARFFSEDKAILYLEDSADEATACSSEMTMSRIIHFATHALANPDMPLLSSIILQNTRKTDGYLMVFEILRCPLAAELVVLSACRTNVGKAVRGEGVFGLVRAFLYAGADSVVATNWNIRDRFTSEFMQRFYHYMFEEKMVPAEALRRAKLDVIFGNLTVTKEGPDEPRDVEVSDDEPESDNSHPYYWAPFILSGLP